MTLAQKKCVPCEGGLPALKETEARVLLSKVHKDWKLENNRLERLFKFKNFVLAMKFVNKVAEISEQENHHPDIHIHYNQVTLSIWTHAIGGLSENDFILAAKIETHEKQ